MYEKDQDPGNDDTCPDLWKRKETVLDDILQISVFNEMNTWVSDESVPAFNASRGTLTVSMPAGH